MDFVQKNTNPEGLVCAVWWWGEYRVKRLVVQEVRAVDNVCGLMGITAENQAVFVFSESGTLSQYLLSFWRL
jgi:hypothetical protein